jgi:hypothetical protein
LNLLFENFQVKESFYDSVSDYISYSLATLDAFNWHIINKGLLVLNYKTYICEFLKFVKYHNAIFSYYSLFGGLSIPVNASGLALEFFTLDQAVDSEKNKFFKHPEFLKYVNITANFGFRINKNVPWMIIADLNSKPMREGHSVTRYTGAMGKKYQSLAGTQSYLASKKYKTKVDGYMADAFIPNINFLFENYYSPASTKSFVLFKNMIAKGYIKFQKDIRYLVQYGKSTLTTSNDFKAATHSQPNRPRAQTKLIEAYKSSLSNDPDSDFTDEKDLNLHFDLSFYLSYFEKLLKYEYSRISDHGYIAFKARFDKQKENKAVANALNLLELFYSPSKIFDPVTKKPKWLPTTNNLTSQKENIMIPNEKVKPTMTQTVTEYYPDF